VRLPVAVPGRAVTRWHVVTARFSSVVRRGRRVLPVAASGTRTISEYSTSQKLLQRFLAVFCLLALCLCHPGEFTALSHRNDRIGAGSPRLGYPS
jgi:hypothetical protein